MAVCLPCVWFRASFNTWLFLPLPTILLLQAAVEMYSLLALGFYLLTFNTIVFEFLFEFILGTPRGGPDFPCITSSPTLQNSLKNSKHCFELKMYEIQVAWELKMFKIKRIRWCYTLIFKCPLWVYIYSTSSLVVIAALKAYETFRRWDLGDKSRWLDVAIAG